MILNPKRKERIVKLPNTVIPHLPSDIVFSHSVMLFLFYVKQFLQTLNVKTYAQPRSVSWQAALPQSRHLSGGLSSEGSWSCLGKKPCQLVAAFTRAGHVSSLICRSGFKTTLENRLKGELEAARERRQKSGRFLTTAQTPGHLATSGQRCPIYLLSSLQKQGESWLPEQTATEGSMNSGWSFSFLNIWAVFKGTPS